MSPDERISSIPLSEISCADCSIGNSVEFRSAQFCPFIVRNYPTGAVLGRSERLRTTSGSSVRGPLPEPPEPVVRPTSCSHQGALSASRRFTNRGAR